MQGDFIMESPAARKPHFRSDGVMHATINGHRLHLREDTGGDSLLWIDGRQPPLILDRTAADFVRLIIDGMWRFQQGEGDESQQVIDYVVDAMYRKHGRPISVGRNRVTRSRIRADLDRVFGTIMTVAEGGCPAEAGLASRVINYAAWTAPARMDLAVTYRCNLGCSKCYLPDAPKMAELTTEQWLQVYDILWRIGVPQVVLTGGEPTLRADITDLVGQADEFVTGLVTNGTQLAQLAEPLRDASLDYAQVTIESSSPDVHDGMTGVVGSHALTVAGIRQAMAAGIQVVTNTTLTRANAPSFVDTIRWLHEALGVEHAACNTIICSGRGITCKAESGLTGEELKQCLEQACREADRLGMDFQWYSPTCYVTGVNPLDLGFGIKACSAAAHNMTIQPDGTVLPCQSWPETIGNILTDPWESIWNHPICLKLRESEPPDECTGCAYEKACAGGCPLDDSPRRKA
jgi:radical SAM protein with 4Fe4S-binding SPASM domain